MKKNRIIKITISLFIAALLVFGITVVVAPDASVSRAENTNQLTELSAYLWTDKSVYSSGTRIDNPRLNDSEVRGTFVFDKSDVLTIPVPDDMSGLYTIGFKYHSVNAKAIDTLFNLIYNGEEKSVLSELLWIDSDKKYAVDRYGNEIPSEQVNCSYSFFAPLYDKRSINSDPVLLDLTGSTEIIVENTTQAVTIEEIWIYNQPEAASYEEYLSEYDNISENDAELITIQGEDYTVKSSPKIRSSNINSPDLYPYNTYNRLINVLDGGSWSSAGQKVMWEFDVEKAGWYEIGVKYCQNSATAKKTYRTVEIDGKLLFSEMQNIPFSQTSDRKYITEFIGDGKTNYKFYLTAGRHTVAMTATIKPAEDIYLRLMELVSEMNDFGSDITKLTAGVTDKNRTWDLNIYLPDALDRLNSFSESLEKIYDDLCGLEGENATYADNLIYARDLIETLISAPRVIPNKMELFNSGDNSAVKHISTVINSMANLSLSIDELYIKPENCEFSARKTAVITKVADSVKRLAYSLTPDATADSYSSKADGEALQVWMSRSSVYVQMLQSLVDSDELFENDRIDITIMPSEQKLVLAAASGTNPDAVIGVAYSTPFKFALRGAAKDLTEYDDFLSSYADEYMIEGLVPCCYENGVYGAIETKDYNVLFYRQDILKDLGIDVPDTWDDVEAIMPTLLRYNKNFSIPISNVVGYKSFNTTSPFIYQNNGEFYSESGDKTDFFSQNSLRGFNELTELFKIYAMDEYVASFYNAFRSGDCPLGIGGVSTYVQLSEAAPELSGLWDIAPVPGTKMQDGIILRYNSCDTTACMIFDNTSKSELSWKFLKWWLSSETQIKFAESMENSFGTQYRWNTANFVAFEETNYPEEHKDIIRRTWEWQKETIQHPASYIVEREVSNAFNKVVVDGDSVIEALEKSALISNREIIRKLKEFGFCDEDGNIIKDYPINVLERLQNKLNESGDGTDEQ